MSFKTVTTIKEGSYTSNINELIRVNPAGVPVVVTLPTAYETNGKEILIKNVTDSLVPITVLPNGTDTIDGQLNFSMNVARMAILFVSDGISNWMPVAKYQ